jgi:prophage regulatory protein
MESNQLHASRILRRKEVEANSGHARSTLYQRIKEGLWPKPVRIGARAVGWPSSEVSALIAARIAGRGDREIRDLVARLEASRTASATSA